MGEIITAVMTGCITLLGVLLSNRAAQAVTDEKLAELTRGWRSICGAWTAGLKSWRGAVFRSIGSLLRERGALRWIFRFSVLPG